VIYRKSIANIDCLIAEPDKPPSNLQTLVCLHGIGGNDASFQPQLDELSDHHRVVVWNMPGYGESAVLENLTFADLSQSLHKLVLELDCGSVHLIGQSIGGMIAQEFYCDFTEQVRSLVLVATTTAFGGKDDSFKNAFLETRLKPLDEGVSMQELAAAAIPSVVAADAEKWVVQSAIDSMSKLNPLVYRDVLTCLVTFNRRDEWPEVSCPVCIIAGSEDTNAPAATLNRMAEKLTQAEYHEITDAGHLVNLEKAAEFNRIVREFFENQ